MISWQPPTDSIIFRFDDVHVWRVNLDCNISDVHNMRHILSLDEQNRADRYYFKEDGEHFILTRGMLRVILSYYLDKEPSELCFSYSSYGKPNLVDWFDKVPLRFNVSHSCGLVLCAVAQNREVGIDLERILFDIDYEQIAKQFFSPGEYAELMEIPNVEQRIKAFYDCWTRKEAYIKAKGEGLSLPLDQFDVSLTPGEPARLLRHNRFPQEVIRWSLKEIQPANGYAASLAVEGQNWNLGCFEASISYLLYKIQV